MLETNSVNWERHRPLLQMLLDLYSSDCIIGENRVRLYCSTGENYISSKINDVEQELCFSLIRVLREVHLKVSSRQVP